MNKSVGEITQISIYLRDEAERINEFVLFQPLTRPSRVTATTQILSQKKWSYTAKVPFYQKIVLKLNQFIFKHLPSLIPNERLTPEAKIKTILALLLSKESLRDYFLADPTRRKNFFFAIEETANQFGYKDFSASQWESLHDPIQISHGLTYLGINHKSLIENEVEFNLQLGALSKNEQNEILFSLLNKIERPPMTSVIEVIQTDSTHTISLTTRYGKYKILYQEPLSGIIHYSFSENHATSNIATQKNLIPDAKGAMNQRVVTESHTQLWIGAYCGELSTTYHVLEQILLILNENEGEISLLDSTTTQAIEKTILFTSLFAWNELEQINRQRSSIRAWDQKILQGSKGIYKLNLLYFNIPFNVLNKYPTPAEVKATLKDINDQALIFITYSLLNTLNLQSDELEQINGRLETLKDLPKEAFGIKEKALLEEIDRFKQLKKGLVDQLKDRNEPLAIALKTLLLEELPNGEKLKGIDQLLYLDYIAKELEVYHNKNCLDATSRSDSADAADKAFYAYQKITSSPFLPGFSTDEEEKLFKILYSMYLVWEEPEVNAALSTSLHGEQSTHYFLKNPEITRYLAL